MAEIRTTGLLDDFDRPAETPVGPPWFQMPGPFGSMDLTPGHLGGTQLPPIGSGAYFTRVSPGGDGDDIEMWGISDGEAPVTEGWRFGMVTVAGINAGYLEGYIVLPHNNVGADSWQLRKYRGGAFTGVSEIAQTPLGALKIGLMRRTANVITTYVSADNGANWTLVNSYTDDGSIQGAAHLGAMYFLLGTTGHNEGWTALGGGLINRQHMYRWQRGFGRVLAEPLGG